MNWKFRIVLASIIGNLKLGVSEWNFRYDWKFLHSNSGQKLMKIGMRNLEFLHE